MNIERSKFGLIEIQGELSNKACRSFQPLHATHCLKRHFKYFNITSHNRRARSGIGCPIIQSRQKRTYKTEITERTVITDEVSLAALRIMSCLKIHSLLTTWEIIQVCLALNVLSTKYRQGNQRRKLCSSVPPIKATQPVSQAVSKYPMWRCRFNESWLSSYDLPSRQFLFSLLLHVEPSLEFVSISERIGRSTASRLSLVCNDIIHKHLRREFVSHLLETLSETKLT